MTKLFAILSLLNSFIGCNFVEKIYYLEPQDNIDYFKVVVRITDFTETSGGTGVILHSDKTGSIILTNRHICELFNKGSDAIVEDPYHIKHLAVSYKLYDKHDLCQMKVNADLGVNIKLAEDQPTLGEEVIVSGHPALLPTIITKGHISEKVIAEIYGETPEPIKMEGVAISALVMGGSSGSPVFNLSGELVGLVFATQGSPGFAIIVPLESIRDFLDSST